MHKNHLQRDKFDVNMKTDRGNVSSENWLIAWHVIYNMINDRFSCKSIETWHLVLEACRDFRENPMIFIVNWTQPEMLLWNETIRLVFVLLILF